MEGSGEGGDEGGGGGGGRRGDGYVIQRVERNQK